jgi:hypothetical protein
MALTKIGKEGITGISNASDATAITIDASENVGIGTTVPYTTSNLNVAGATSTSTTAFGPTNPPAAGQLDIRSTDAYSTQRGGKLTLSGNSGTSGAVALSVYGAIQGVKTNATINNAGGGLSFSTTLNANGLLTERMRIDASGNLLVGKTAAGQVLTQGAELNSSGGVFATTASAGDSSYFVNKATSGTRYLIRFYANTSHIGSITSDGSSTTYATSSDYRLKENVDYTWDATTRLKQLKPARFNFIVDETNTPVDGFLAHEVSSIVPEAITGTKDAMTTEVLYVEGDELPDGISVGDVKEASVPDYQGIDQSKLVPLLVKTIQELEARITALEA